VITGYVEPSGEDAELARREVAGAVEALDGRAAGPPGTPVAGLLEVQVPAEASLASLASRLALARRTLVLVDRSGSALEAAGREGAGGRSAAFRRLGRPGAAADAAVRAAGRAYVLGGGTIDLDAPQRRYWLARQDDGTEALLQEVAAVERAQATLRAMPRLPFRRPVSLPPRLARAAANLASIRPGERVLDPFLGTGALLAEAALLGARVYGLDADPAMVRGALRNFAHLGVRAEAFVEGDSRVVEFPGGKRTFDAILTDPPYGRASASVGAEPSRLVPEVLSRWQGSVRPAGRIVVLSPGGPALMAEPWVEDCRVPVRVHRSLTREFRRYRRAA
jgi:putative methyltransferase (TIGR01177 family)